MTEYIAFAGRHPLLFLALFAVLGAIGYTEVRPRMLGLQKIGPAMAMRLMNDEEAIIVDVRTEADFKAGHIPGARQINMAEVKNGIPAVKDKDKNKPVIVYCRSGNTSNSACAQLKKQGYENVYNLSGGIAGWEAEKLPMHKS